ncbi:hypothetical protein IU427_33690 [Nocardia beijingensis]|nr:hypothetical protein [Nocardia beijingensis]
MDSASVRAKRDSLTGRKPVDRGKAGSKIHVLSDADGIPLVTAVTGTDVHDSRMLRPLVEAIPVRGAGRPPPARPVARYASAWRSLAPCSKTRPSCSSISHRRARPTERGRHQRGDQRTRDTRTNRRRRPQDRDDPVRPPDPLPRRRTTGRDRRPRHAFASRRPLRRLLARTPRSSRVEHPLVRPPLEFPDVGSSCPALPVLGVPREVSQ